MDRFQTESVKGEGHQLVCRSQLLVMGTSQTEVEYLLGEFGQYYQEIANALRGSADEIVSGRWTMLGHEYDLRKPLDWHSDPKTGHRWERKFFADLSLSVPGCDVKYVWEPSRHQYLSELGRHWLINQDEQAAELALDHLEDWILENPLYEGVNWTSALEPAMRAIAWAWTIPTLEEPLAKRGELLKRITLSLADHATYLEHHLSYYSSPFNHLIGEAVGLYLVSYLLGDHANSRRWRDLSRSVLQTHTERQFYADGMTVEQAMGYHFYTLGFLAMAILIARSEQRPMQHVEQVVHRAFRAGLAFRRPDGTWPPIGDLDNARSLPCHPADYWNFGSLCSLAAVMFEDASLIVDDSPGQELYWLLGTDGVRRWHDLNQNHRTRQTPDSNSSVGQQYFLPDSGYAIASRDQSWFLFDAGPIAGGLFEDSTPSTAHGHADTLGILYCHSGTPTLRDSGISSYADKQQADFARSAKAHNTIEVEEAPSARHAGHLAWANVAPTPEFDACLCDDVWLARGRLFPAPSISITRSILGLPNCGLWIADLVSTDRRRMVSWYWHLGTTKVAEELLGNDLVWRIGSHEIIRSYCFTKTRNYRVETAGDNSNVGWYSTNYGTLQPGGRLSFHEPCDKQLLVLTYVGTDATEWTIERVQSGGIAIDCIESAESSVDLPDIDSQIAWTLKNRSLRQTYFGGIQPNEDSPGLPRLVPHAGNWLCAERSLHL